MKQHTAASAKRPVSMPTDIESSVQHKTSASGAQYALPKKKDTKVIAHFV